MWALKSGIFLFKKCWIHFSQLAPSRKLVPNSHIHVSYLNLRFSGRGFLTLRRILVNIFSFTFFEDNYSLNEFSSSGLYCYGMYLVTDIISGQLFSLGPVSKLQEYKYFLAHKTDVASIEASITKDPFLRGLHSPFPCTCFVPLLLLLRTSNSSEDSALADLHAAGESRLLQTAILGEEAASLPEPQEVSSWVSACA